MADQETGQSAFEFECPYCDHRINSNEKILRETGECPNCHYKIVLPGITNNRTGFPGRMIACVAVFLIVAAAGIMAVVFHRTGAPPRQADAKPVATISATPLLAATDASPNLRQYGIDVADPIVKPIISMYVNLAGAMSKMNDDIDALHETDVFLERIYGDKAGIQAEIDKRVAGQNIIEQCRKELPDIINAARKQFDSIPVSDSDKSAALRGFDKGIATRMPELDKMYSLRLQQQNSEMDLLKFMLDQFGDYSMSDQNISFKTPGNTKKYDELTQVIQDTAAENKVFQKNLGESIKTLAEEYKRLYPQ